MYCRVRGILLASGFVEAGPSDVANPFDDVVVGVVQLGLKHLKEELFVDLTECIMLIFITISYQRWKLKNVVYFLSQLKGSCTTLGFDSST